MAKSRKSSKKKSSKDKGVHCARKGKKQVCRRGWPKKIKAGKYFIVCPKGAKPKLTKM